MTRVLQTLFFLTFQPSHKLRLFKLKLLTWHKIPGHYKSWGKEVLLSSNFWIVIMKILCNLVIWMWTRTFLSVTTNEAKHPQASNNIWDGEGFKRFIKRQAACILLQTRSWGGAWAQSKEAEFVREAWQHISFSSLGYFPHSCQAIVHRPWMR